MGSRSQGESEQPAKVYQLDAVQTQVDALGRQLNEKMDKILEQTSTLVTEERLKDEVAKIHLKYGPMKSNITWFTRTLVITIIGQIVVAYFTFFRKM